MSIRSSRSKHHRTAAFGGGGGGAPTFNLSISGLTNIVSKSFADAPQNNGIAISPDGTVLWLCSTAAIFEVNEYILSTPEDIISAGAVNGTKTLPGESNITSFAVSTDGDFLFYLGTSADTIRRMPVSTPWSIATAGAVDDSVSIAVDIPNAVGLSFNFDGTKMYVYDAVPRDIGVYVLSTPWQPSTKGAITRSADLRPDISAAEGMYVTPDERYIMLGDGVLQELLEMLTPGDISTLTYLHEATAGFPGIQSKNGYVEWNTGSKVYSCTQGQLVFQADT